MGSFHGPLLDSSGVGVLLYGPPILSRIYIMAQMREGR